MFVHSEWNESEEAMCKSVIDFGVVQVDQINPQSGWLAGHWLHLFLSHFQGQMFLFFSRTISMFYETWWVTFFNIVALFGVEIWSYQPSHLVKSRLQSGHDPTFRLRLLWLWIASNCIRTFRIYWRLVATSLFRQRGAWHWNWPRLN